MAKEGFGLSSLFKSFLLCLDVLFNEARTLLSAEKYFALVFSYEIEEPQLDKATAVTITEKILKLFIMLFMA